jgi:hypothetical protein
MHAHPDHGHAFVVLMDRMNHATNCAADDRDDRDPGKPGDRIEHRFNEVHGLTFPHFGLSDRSDKAGGSGVRLKRIRPSSPDLVRAIVPDL